MNKQRRPPNTNTTRRAASRRKKTRRAPAAISHAECEAQLEFYVDGERRGDKVQTLFPAIGAHLQSCDRCRASYDLMTETLRDESPLDSSFPTAARLAPPLPFVQPPQDDAAWTKQVRSSIGGAPLGFGFTLKSSHLRTLLSPTAPQLVYRDESPPTDRTLLVSDTLSLGRREVAVELWAIRAPDSARIQLKASVASSIELPGPLHAILRWNDHRASAIVRDGECVFDVPAAALENARDLRIEFEVTPSNLAAEKPRAD